MVERAGKEAQHKRENFQDAVLEARDKKQRQRARDLQNQVYRYPAAVGYYAIEEAASCLPFNHYICLRVSV